MRFAGFRVARFMRVGARSDNRLGRAKGLSGEVYYPAEMMSSGNQEIEVKLRVHDLAAFRRRLARLGLRPTATGRVHERNTLFDTPQGGLAKHGQLLRVRRVTRSSDTRRPARPAHREAILTYKGPTVKATPAGASPGGRYKVRQELEVGVADSQQLQQILEALGLRGWFRYEKYRTSYQLPASLRWARGLQVELDETPIGVFVEFEGPPPAIDRAAKLLGYTPADYITKSYLALYLERCRKEGVPAADMIFPATKKSAEK